MRARRSLRPALHLPWYDDAAGVPDAPGTVAAPSNALDAADLLFEAAVARVHLTGTCSGGPG